VSGGKIYIFQTGTYNLLYTVEPEMNSLFADVAFSGSSSKFAVFEYKSILVDRSSRIRIYNSQSGDLDRDLPYLPAKPGTEPGNHYPLISYSPADSAIAITIDKSMGPRTFLVKSNDGAIIREFKGSCHAFSPDGSLLAVGGHVYSTDKWTDQGKFGTSALNLAFSPTERVLIVISSEHLRRYRIE
jgi:WD40 repeat protein